MTPRRLPDTRWMIRERPWVPRRNAVWESIFTVANGYIGVRGYPEETFDAGPTTPMILVAGLFEPGDDDVPELVALPDFLAMDIELGGEPLRLAAGRVSEYERLLDLRRGLLRRTFIYEQAGRRTRLELERLASLANPHLVAQSITVTPLNWRGEATVRFWMDRPGGSADRFRPLHARHVARDRILSAAETLTNRTRVGHACRCCAWVRQTAPPRAEHLRDEDRIGLGYTATLESGQRAVFDRLVTTYTSRDPETVSVERSCLRDLRGLDGAAYGVQRRRHVRRWAGRWRRADIAIDGPEEDQQAVRFAVFQLVGACPPRDPTVGIAAKGLTGPGYRGHVFWDTEVFMLPHFTWTHPGSARRILDYRYRNLPGARRKAAAKGYAGAMFPWESADTGDEACPDFVPDPITGRPVRVLTGQLQHHIAADVAYGCREYIAATGENRYRERQGLVLAVETARFWAGRVQHDPASGRYEIRDVIGPDEYHEHVDNNAYTNFMAAWNLRYAADEVERMRAAHPRSRLLRQLDVGTEEITFWRSAAQGLASPRPDESGLIEQYDGFFRLLEGDPEALSSRVSTEPEAERMARVHRCQILKQPDVLMVMAMFPGRYDEATVRRNWDYYEPRTTHDSSLSPCVHSIVASDLDLSDRAYEYFRRSARIDLDDINGNTDSGLHCAALGGTWQAVMRGFLGLRAGAGGPTVRPALPPAWRSVRTQVSFRGRWLTIEADRERATVRPAGGR